MREMSLTARREVIAKCVADHHMPPDPEDDVPGHVSIVDSARILHIKPGHAPHDPETGICPTCGYLSFDSDQYRALPERERWSERRCAERADWVVELRYHVVHEPATRYSPEKRDVEYGAVYGVTLEGDRLNVSCWQD